MDNRPEPELYGQKLSELTNRELRVECGIRNLLKTGTREDVLQRVFDSVTSTSIASPTPPTTPTADEPEGTREVAEHGATANMSEGDAIVKEVQTLRRTNSEQFLDDFMQGKINGDGNGLPK